MTQVEPTNGGHRAAWERPEVQRLDAAEAEVAILIGVDGGAFSS